MIARRMSRGADGAFRRPLVLTTSSDLWQRWRRTAGDRVAEGGGKEYGRFTALV